MKVKYAYLDRRNTYELEIPEIDWGALFTECRTGDAWEDTDYSICDEDGETVVAWND